MNESHSERETRASADIVRAVFHAWVVATGRTDRTVLTSKRSRLIAARLAEGYSVDDLVDAVRGWQRSSFHCGQNETGTVYNALELLLRDAAHVEMFRDAERGAAPVRVNPTTERIGRIFETGVPA